MFSRYRPSFVRDMAIRVMRGSGGYSAPAWLMATSYDAVWMKPVMSLSIGFSFLRCGFRVEDAKRLKYDAVGEGVYSPEHIALSIVYIYYNLYINSSASPFIITYFLSGHEGKDSPCLETAFLRGDGHLYHQLIFRVRKALKSLGFTNPKQGENETVIYCANTAGDVTGHFASSLPPPNKSNNTAVGCSVEGRALYIGSTSSLGWRMGLTHTDISPPVPGRTVPCPMVIPP